MVNGVADWTERLIHSEEGSLGRMDNWVESRNVVADDAKRDIRIGIGGALVIVPFVGKAAAPVTASNIIKQPGTIWGQSVDDITSMFKAEGLEVSVRQSTRGSGNATIIKIKGHETISQIQVHSGGGRHGGAYYKISTTTQGKIKVVNPSTYKPTSDEKALIINSTSGSN